MRCSCEDDMSPFAEIPCRNCLENENAGLDEEVSTLKEALRWRKWPEEKPEKPGYYFVRIAHASPIASWFDGEKFVASYYVTHWLPIPPMGEE